jgi:hypothetical protein
MRQPQGAARFVIALRPANDLRLIAVAVAVGFLDLLPAAAVGSSREAAGPPVGASPRSRLYELLNATVGYIQLLDKDGGPMPTRVDQGEEW